MCAAEIHTRAEHVKIIHVPLHGLSLPLLEGTWSKVSLHQEKYFAPYTRAWK